MVQIRVEEQTLFQGVAQDPQYRQAFLVDINGVVWEINHEYESKKIEGLKDIVQISCGYMETIALASDGTVYQFDNFAYSKKFRILELQEIKQISAGANHFAAIDKYGQLWSWGNNVCGELGNGTFESNIVPEKIDFNDVKEVKCSTCFTVALKHDGTVWSWGDNKNGQLGHSDNSSINIPVIVPIEKRVEKMGVGKYHVVVLDEGGRLWGFGSNKSWRLGSEKDYSGGEPLEIIICTDDIKDISCGDDSSFALDTNGDVFLWGYIEPGYGSIKPKLIFRDEEISDISAGMHTAYFLKHDGTLWRLKYSKGFRNHLIDVLDLGLFIFLFAIILLIIIVVIKLIIKARKRTKKIE